MKFSTRQLVTLAVFGALWGAVEIGLGSVLHAIKIPLSGLILAAVGLLVALVGRLFVPKRGSTLFIGVVAMVLKLFSIGTVIIGPMIGILAEALIAELILSVFSMPSRVSFLLAGAGGALWTLVQPFFTGFIIFGREIFSIWLDTLDMGARIFGFDAQAGLLVILALSGLHILVGGVGGWLGWSSGNKLIVRLGRNFSMTAES